MKIQNMSVIFIIIIIPIMLVASYYIGLQIDTINMQTSYDQKLLSSTKDAIDAFEINTTEWNSEYSLVSDSKRRDVTASINTFTTSLANNLGMSGATSQEILNYVPAIAYTLYDGFYVYSCRTVNKLEEDDNGLTVLDDDGNVTLEGSKSEYTLSPYTAYTEQLRDYVINYTMDNYMKVYDINSGITKQGFLSVTGNNQGIDGIISNEINTNIKFKGQSISPETLTEQICYYDGLEYKKETYKYIYDKDNEKLYYDDATENFFRLNNSGEIVYLQNVSGGSYNQYTYKKICIPVYNSGNWEVLKLYQALNGDRKGKYYRVNYEKFSPYNYDTDEVIALRDLTVVDSYLGDIGRQDIFVDFSDVNYCVDSYVFSKWVDNNLNGITTKVEGQENVKIFEISVNNNPDPESENYGNSVLAIHKREVMSEKIAKGLMQSLELVHGQNVNYEYRLPELSVEDWNQALSNVSIIAFMQGMPIGLKHYNNYQIATSTKNKEFVNPHEIYFSGEGDQYYHKEYCKSATESNYIGYRSVDYKVKTRTQTKIENTPKTYYYAHDNKNNTDSEMACYDCIVNRSTYTQNSSSAIKEKQYYEALTRERYMQKENVIVTDIVKFTITKTCDKTEKVYYEDEITYTIKVTNRSTTFAEEITIQDEFSQINEFVEIIEISDYGQQTENIVEWKATIPVGGTKTFTIKARIIGKPGEYKNTAKVNADGLEFKSIEVVVRVNKKVIINASTKMQPTNIVFVLDSSQSMMFGRSTAVSNAVSDFVQKMIDNNDTKSQVSAVRFSALPIVGMFGVGSLAWNSIWWEGTNRQYYYTNNGEKNGLAEFQKWICHEQLADGDYSLEKILEWLQSGPSAVPLGATPFDAAFNYPRNIIERGVSAMIGSKGAYQVLDTLSKREPTNRNIVIFLSDGDPFSLDNFSYKEFCKTIQNDFNAIIFGIGFKNSGDFVHLKTEVCTNLNELDDLDKKSISSTAIRYYESQGRRLFL